MEIREIMDKQREIKFRFYDKTDKRMKYFDGIWNMPDPSYDFDDIQQFTGLLDKNGKEIYEGDIVLGRFILDDVEDYIYLSLTDMERKNQSKTFLIEDISYLYTNPIPEDIEVIGNVHENPELLKDN